MLMVHERKQRSSIVRTDHGESSRAQAKNPRQHPLRRHSDFAGLGMGALANRPVHRAEQGGASLASQGFSFRLPSSDTELVGGLSLCECASSLRRARGCDMEAAGEFHPAPSLLPSK